MSWQSNGKLSREVKKVKLCASRERRKIRSGASSTAEAVPLLLREKALIKAESEIGCTLRVKKIFFYVITVLTFRQYKI